MDFFRDSRFQTFLVGVGEVGMSSDHPSGLCLWRLQIFRFVWVGFFFFFTEYLGALETSSHL